jgi:hypothetical protein
MRLGGPPSSLYGSGSTEELQKNINLRIFFIPLFVDTLDGLSNKVMWGGGVRKFGLFQ